MIVYQITCAVNGKAYIGITTRGGADIRWTEHVRSAMKPRPRSPLHRAIAKYGADQFVVCEILCVLPQHGIEALHDSERKLIAARGTLRPDGYNMTAGGDGTPGYRHTDAERKRRSMANAKGNNPWHGREHDARALAKISAASRANWEMPEYREVRRVAASKPRNLTEEQRRHWSDRQRGERNHMWGRTMTDEQKAARAETSRKMWERRKAEGWTMPPDALARMAVKKAAAFAKKRALVGGAFTPEELTRRTAAIMAGKQRAKMARLAAAANHMPPLEVRT